MPPLLSLAHVDKRYANGVLALSDVSLSVGPREFVALLGPSGCGKSTALRLFAGLDSATSGTVHAPALAPANSADTACVFQDATLMPWASVFDNVWLPLRVAGRPRRDAAPQVHAALQSVGLADFAHAYPGELSGGMKMRASIARALVAQPRVLLMDEPFAALDEFTRQKLNDDLLHWWQGGPPAVLFVTHSIFEAVYLSQRVLVMGARPGRIVAEVAIDEPYPRSTGFRTSARYLQACTEISQALEAAQVAA
jgi:NitT/TauT family transport system ATP-binding protein